MGVRERKREREREREKEKEKVIKKLTHDGLVLRM